MSTRYTSTAILFHWLIALLMVCNVVMIWFEDFYPESWVRPVIDTHKSIGITVLGLALLRILWRIGNPPPELMVASNKEKIAAHVAHGLLYLVIVTLPLSGWLHDSAWNKAAEHPMRLFTLVPWPRLPFIVNLDFDTKEHLHRLFGDIHSALAYVLYGLFVLHVAGALKHQFVDKQRQLQRMWFGK